MNWRVEFHGHSTRRGLEKVPDELLARFLRYAERMQEHGPDLGMPHTRALGRGLFELRLVAGSRIARVFFAVGSGRRIVILHSFVKKSQKTPLPDLALARKRQKDVT